MKHTWKIAVAAAVLAGSAGIAKADITLSGPTGLFLNPTAQIVAKDAPEVAVDYQRHSDHGTHGNVLGVAGAIQLADRLEVNGGFHRLGGAGSSNVWNVGAKYQLITPREKGFGVAVGADYNKVTHSGGNMTDGYIVGTKSFNTNATSAPIQGSLGLRYNDVSGGVGSKVDVFGGVAVPLSSTGEVSLIGELGSKRFDYGESPYAVGVRYHPTGSSFNLGAGYARGALGGLSYGGKGLFVQAGYQFGK